MNRAKVGDKEEEVTFIGGREEMLLIMCWEIEWRGKEQRDWR